MNLLAVLGIVLAAVVAAVGLMYAVRRIAGHDYFLEDTTRGSAIFGVVGTAFAVLLAFVMFVAFQGYTNAKEAAAVEAASLDAMFDSSRYFPAEERFELEALLLCYARSVVHQEWELMRDGDASPITDHWRHLGEQRIRSLSLDSESRRAGYGQLLVERDARSDARQGRLTESESVVSAPVWLILGLSGLATVAFVLLFTDRREAFAVQACMMAAVAAMVSASLTLVWFLDHPYQGASGSLEPDEMERAVGEIEAERADFPLPCDRAGEPRKPAA